MSTIANFPNPCLVAILLVCNTRSGSGAQILYHYPHVPLADEVDLSKSRSVLEDSDNELSSDSASSSAEEEEEGLFTLTRTRSDVLAASNHGLERTPPTQINTRRRHSHEDAASNSLFGLDEDGLVNLLVPDRSWHKRRFELGVNNLTFIGRPAYVRHDGTWTRRTRTTRKVPEVDVEASDTVSASDNDTSDKTGKDDSPKGHQSEGTTKEPVKSPLTMFHVVFVMNPPPLEHISRVKDMYDHVVKKLSRALKWEQARNDLVWKQTELMLSLRSANTSRRASKSQMMTEILQKSSLANAVSTVYNAIANSRIASVTLSSKVTVSLQIPPITSTAHLPSLTEPPIQPGLWLTTSTDMASTALEGDYNAAPSTTQLAKHYTLLLKSAPQRIAKDALEAGGPLAHTLPKFLSALRPTKSFYKLQLATQMAARDIQLLAQHLVYWRRAIAVPPLYQGDTYIVSPNADLRKLYDAAKAYEREFPVTMPSLPKMLSFLSGKPRPYGSLIPSTDHKEIYFLALAWLMRHGWVTQLRTFTCIRVSPETKRAVRGLDSEPRSRQSNQPGGMSSHDDGRDPTRPLAKRPSMVSHVSSEGKRSIDAHSLTRNNKMASLVLNPPRASPLESRWLAYIGDYLTDEDATHLSLSPEDVTDVRRYWPLFVKYFNGQVALQTIPVRESLKRKFVWALLDKLGINQFGGIEDEEGKNQRLLVTVRHW